MTYFVKSISGAELFKSEKATNIKEALQEAVSARANLSRADLCGANLCGANLCGAKLGGAKLGEQWIIQGQVRSDGYAFLLQRLKDDKEPMIKAGCRYLTLADAEKHWTATRAGTPLFHETRAIVRAMVDTMHMRGLK
jgi:hypothetical protein